MPQYTLHKIELRDTECGVRSEERITTFLAKDDANAFSQVSQEIGVPLKDRTFSILAFFATGATKICKGDEQIFPEKTPAHFLLVK